MFSETLRHNLVGIRASIPPVKLDSLNMLRKNLIFMAQVMKASGPLLRHVAKHMNQSTPFGVLLAEYCDKHYFEEFEHYDWMMDDLGLTESIEHRDWLAAQICGAQYYMIKHMHPAALLGHMAALEFDPVPLSVVEELEALHGKRIMRCVRYHAEHDLDHQQELAAVIDKAPSELHSLILESAVHTARLLGMARSTWEN